MVRLRGSDVEQLNMR